MSTPLGSAGTPAIYIGYFSEACNQGQTLEFVLTATAIETIDQNKVPTVRKTVTANKFAGIAMHKQLADTFGPVCYSGPVMALVDTTVAAGEMVELDLTNDVLTDRTTGNIVGVALEAGPASGTALKLVFVQIPVYTDAAVIGYGGA